MDPISIASGLAAAVFALLAFLQWRRASELEGRVTGLEAEVATLRKTAENAEAEAAEERAAAAEVTAAADAAVAKAREETKAAKAAAAAAAAPKPAAAAPAPSPAPTPSPGPAPTPSPKSASKSDPGRLAQLHVVSEAFETCRYLDFNAIVEKPSTYRVTVPITQANAAAVRGLEDGMFACLKRVSLEADKAVLHIDTSQGPP